MRLSTSTCMFFNRPDGSKADIIDTLKYYKDAGYEVLDFNFHDLAMFTSPMWTDSWLSYIYKVKDEADKYGLTFSQGHSHFYNYCDSKIQNKEWLDDMIDKDIKGAGILGIKSLVFHAATDWESQTQLKSSKEKGIEYFKRILEKAEKVGTKVAIENLWEMNIAPKRRYCSFVEELVDLVDSLDSENVGICWDFEHGAIMQQDQVAALKLVGPRLIATHISDFVTIKHDHILPYQGNMNVDEMLEAIAQLDYKGDFTYETHNYTMRLPLELMPEALRYSYKLGEYLIKRHDQIKEKMKEDGRIR